MIKVETFPTFRDVMIYAPSLEVTIAVLEVPYTVDIPKCRNRFFKFRQTHDCPSRSPSLADTIYFRASIFIHIQSAVPLPQLEATLVISTAWSGERSNPPDCNEGE